MIILFQRYQGGSDYEPLNIFQAGDNELIALEIIHRYVELLDKYFGSVSFPLQIIPDSFKPVKLSVWNFIY